MEFVQVESDNVDGIAYDSFTKRMLVRFKRDGRVYEYQNVAQEHHDTVMAAERPGKAFMSIIRPNHRGKLLIDDDL